MKLPAFEPAVNRRLLISAALACVAIMIFAAERLLTGAAADLSLRKEDQKVADVVIGQALDTLFVRYGIDRKAVSTWQVHAADRRFSRTEQRVFVSPEFVSLQFNHDLSELIAPSGLRVAATERAKENSVTMHIVHEELTVWSVTFLVK